MVSEMAMEDVDSLAKKGINLTPREIIRLNALGCRCERQPNASSFYALPRCAFLGEAENQIVFREPSIGQQLWLDNICRIYDDGDDTTAFFLKAYSMTKMDLPEWTDIKTIQEELKKFIGDVLKSHTIRQVIACIDYCLYGCDSNAMEFPIEDNNRGKEEEETSCDEIQSTAIGVIHDSQAMGLGIPLDDAMKMTTSELQAVIQRAYENKGIDISKEMKNRAIGEYYKTLDAMKNRHNKKDEEKEV